MVRNFNSSGTVSHSVIARTLLASCIATISMGSAACTVAVDREGMTEREEKRFTVTKAPVDLVLLTFDGNVEVRSWDRAEVLVQIEKRGHDKDSLSTIEVLSDQKGDTIQVEARRTKSKSSFVGVGFFVGPSAKLIASVPRNTNVKIDTRDGSVVIERVTGRTDIRTGDGSIRATETGGELRAETSDGSIQIEDIAGRVEARTGDGSITVSGTPGSLRARSGDGSIVLRIRNGAVMTDDWMVATGDGSVTVELPDGFAAQIDADPGSDGRVTNELTLTGSGGGTRDKRPLTGVLGAGGKRLSIKTGDGRISLRSY